MLNQDTQKDNLMSSISRESDIVWLRWLLFFLVIPIYLFSFDRQIDFLFVGLFVAGIIYNSFNHMVLINKQYHEGWFSNNIYIDLIFVTALIFVDGGFDSSIYISYYLIIIYEGVKKNVKQPIFLSIFVSILYTVSNYFLNDSINASQIILRNVFIILCGIFVYQISSELIHQGKLQKKHYDMYIKDQLTGLYNRNVFEKVLNEGIENCKSNNNQICLLLFDIDNFQIFNDTYGRFTGDDLLKYFSKIILESITENDTAFRYGGEEFIVLLKDVDIKDAYKKAETIRKKLSSSKIYVADDDDKYKITVSCGIANCPEHSASYYELLEYADKALYEAKSDGKNIVVIFEKV